MAALEDIASRARDLLADGKVRAVLGYRRTSAGTLAAPAFVTEPDDLASLVWDPTCVHNLARHLVNEKKRQKTAGATDDRPLAVIAKGCDSRAIVVLMQENHIRRDEVVILGVSCGSGGMIDQRKVAAALNGNAAAALAFAADGAVRASTADGEVDLPADAALADRCLECTTPYPAVTDVMFGEKVDSRPYRPRFSALGAVAGKSIEERAAFWTGHFERCLRCYACRAVCPMCYCEECVVGATSVAVAADTSADDKANRIHWIRPSPSAAENAMYHMVRAMHLAGRCIDCGECERVCPVNIPARLLNNMLEREALAAFEYVPGLDPEQPSLISSFREGDPNDFIR